MGIYITGRSKIFPVGDCTSLLPSAVGDVLGVKEALFFHFALYHLQLLLVQQSMLLFRKHSGNKTYV